MYIFIETVPTSEMFKTKATVLALNLTPRRTVGPRQVNTTRVETFVAKWSWTYIIYVYMYVYIYIWLYWTQHVYTATIQNILNDPKRS